MPPIRVTGNLCQGPSHCHHRADTANFAQLHSSLHVPDMQSRGLAINRFGLTFAAIQTIQCQAVRSLYSHCTVLVSLLHTHTICSKNCFLQFEYEAAQFCVLAECDTGGVTMSCLSQVSGVMSYTVILCYTMLYLQCNHGTLGCRMKVSASIQLYCDLPLI